MSRSSIWHTKFDPDADYEVAKPFLFAGETLEVGERFDFKVPERKLRTLFLKRLIRPVELPSRTAEKEEGGPSPEAGLPDPVPMPPPEIVAISGGWYRVVAADGTVLSGDRAVRRAEAERIVAEAER